MVKGKRLRASKLDIKTILAAKDARVRKKKLEAERIKRMIANLTPPKKRFELKCVQVLHTPDRDRKKVWCIDWNPFPTPEMLLSTDQLAQSSRFSFPTMIKKWALASCGEDGMTIWNEHAVARNLKYIKQEKWVGMFRSCSWHPLGKMIAGGTISGMEEPEGYVYIWNNINGNWNEHSKICIEGSTADVVGLSWIENKLLCCMADGYFYVIQVDMSGGHVLATLHDNTNADINFVKWHLGNSNYFICGGHRGLEIYRFSKTQELLWNIEKAAIRTSTTAAAGICFDPDNGDGSEFVVFKFAGGIKTWELNITKDYMGRDLISLNFIHMHGERRSLDSKITTSTSTYISFDWSRITTIVLVSPLFTWISLAV